MKTQRKLTFEERRLLKREVSQRRRERIRGYGQVNPHIRTPQPNQFTNPRT